MTSTVAPFGSGSSDHARKASDPPRILITTSPGPVAPRVLTVKTPIRPKRDESGAISHRLSSSPVPARSAGDPIVLSGMPVGVFGQSNSTSPLVMTRHERIRRYDKMLDL